MYCFLSYSIGPKLTVLTPTRDPDAPYIKTGVISGVISCDLGSGEKQHLGELLRKKQLCEFGLSCPGEPLYIEHLLL